VPSSRRSLAADPLRFIRLFLSTLALTVLAAFVAAKINSPEAVDAHVYWSAHFPDLYDRSASASDQSYHYSPAFAQLIAPATWVPFPVFQAIWLVAQTAILVWLIGPIVAAILLMLPFTNVFEELVLGNIHIILAAALVVSFRYPATWALFVLTKVTPGIGLLWYAFRREWNQLALAVGVVAAITAVSFVLAPTQWTDWVAWLANTPAPSANPNQLLTWAPLALRLLVSGGVVWLAATSNERWLMPIAVWLALPVIWYNSLVLLTAAVPIAAYQMRQAPTSANAQYRGRAYKE
jgi:hypothetical protein